MQFLLQWVSVMCSKCLNVDALSLCLLDLDKGGNEFRFPTTQHSHSSIQSQFTVAALSPLLTLAILSHSSTTVYAFYSLWCDFYFSIPKESTYLSRCRVGAWLSIWRTCHISNKAAESDTFKSLFIQVYLDKKKNFFIISIIFWMNQQMTVNICLGWYIVLDRNSFVSPLNLLPVFISVFQSVSTLCGSSTGDF